jgi:hypothetical protein
MTDEASGRPRPDVSIDNYYWATIDAETVRVRVIGHAVSAPNSWVCYVLGEDRIAIVPPSDFLGSADHT